MYIRIHYTYVCVLGPSAHAVLLHAFRIFVQLHSLSTSNPMRLVLWYPAFQALRPTLRASGLPQVAILSQRPSSLHLGLASAATVDPPLSADQKQGNGARRDVIIP